MQTTLYPDYVFEPDYRLMPIAELRKYIDQHHRLPEMPSAADVEKDGLNLGETNKLLTKKVEELTLYLIEKDKENKALKTQVDHLSEKLEKELSELKAQINKK